MDLVIFGAGDIARHSRHSVVAFTVDRAYRQADTFLDLPLVDFEDIASAFPPSRFGMFIALSYAKMNHVRADKYTQARALGYTLATYISSKCTWLTDHLPGDNCFILEDNTIQPFVRIGSDVTLWS